MTLFSPDNTNPDCLPQDSSRREIAVVNAEIADNLALLLGPESFEHVANLFIDQATDALEEIHRAVPVRSYDEIASLSHKIKGSASTVGCDILADIYGKIERAAKNEEPEKLDQLTTLLLDATPKSLSALSDYV